MSAKYKASKKDRVLRKTGGYCAHCGKKISKQSLTLDHFIPKSFGSTAIDANCMPLCVECNNKKADKAVNPRHYYKFASKDAREQCCKYRSDFIEKGYIKEYILRQPAEYRDRAQNKICLWFLYSFDETYSRRDGLYALR